MIPNEIRPYNIAYFSMEVGLDSSMPTYSGGLGILAGDTLRAAADLGLPMIGVTLLHRKGYFRQTLDADGNQSESPAGWDYEEVLEPMVPRAFVPIAGRAVMVRAWRYVVRGVFGHQVPVYFLDTGLKENEPWEQSLTEALYDGDIYLVKPLSRESFAHLPQLMRNWTLRLDLPRCGAGDERRGDRGDPCGA